MIIEEKIINEVTNELRKDPFVYESVRVHIEDANRDMKMIGKTELISFPTDLVTYIGASENQKKIVQKLINKYGSHILDKILVQIYYGEKGDWRTSMK